MKMFGRDVFLGTWHVYACAGNIIPHVRVDTCDLAFTIMCNRTCGKIRVEMFVSAVVLHVWEQTMLDGTIQLIVRSLILLHS